jgi:hypothetical protein
VLRHTVQMAAVLAATMTAGPGPALAQVPSPDATWGGRRYSAFVASRPSSVPLDYVPTPNGYSDPTCVFVAHKNDIVRGNRIERSDGTVQELPTCNRPRYDKAGHAIIPGARKSAPTVNQWVARADDDTPPIEWLSATWTVPSPPPSDIGQIIYLFPGLEPGATGDTILQPVLAWNGLYAPDGWAIYSWNCCRNGNQIYSDPVAASTGETISGYASGSNCHQGTGVCDDWQVRISNTNYSSTLDTDAYGEVLNWTFGGAVEVYSVNSCREYPASESVSYQNISVNQVGGAVVTPQWTEVIYGGVSPNCITDVAAAGGNVTISWCVPSTCSGRCGSPPDTCGGTLSCGGCSGTGMKCWNPSHSYWWWAGQYCSQNFTCVSNPCDDF